MFQLSFLFILKQVAKLSMVTQIAEWETTTSPPRVRISAWDPMRRASIIQSICFVYLEDRDELCLKQVLLPQRDNQTKLIKPLHGLIQSYVQEDLPLKNQSNF